MPGVESRARGRRALAIASAVLAVLPPPAPAQAPDHAAEDGAADPFAAEWPFPVGEAAEYDVTFGPVRVGRARLAVEAVDSVRSVPAYRLAFELEGGPFFYQIDDRTVSWLATGPYRSLRFEQVLREGGYRRHRRWEIDPERGHATREDWDDEAGGYRPHPTLRQVPIPAGALDEIAFLFLARTLPLEVGRIYRFDRYFEPEGNPVIIEVLRREQVRVRAGRFETVVVRPVIRTGGMFGEGGEAEVYITDDDRRLIVQMRSRMKVGRVDMYLRTIPGGR